MCDHTRIINEIKSGFVLLIESLTMTVILKLSFLCFVAWWLESNRIDPRAKKGKSSQNLFSIYSKPIVWKVHQQAVQIVTKSDHRRIFLEKVAFKKG